MYCQVQIAKGAGSFDQLASPPASHDICRVASCRVAKAIDLFPLGQITDDLAHHHHPSSLIGARVGVWKSFLPGAVVRANSFVSGSRGADPSRG